MFIQDPAMSGTYILKTRNMPPQLDISAGLLARVQQAGQAADRSLLQYLHLIKKHISNTRPADIQIIGIAQS